MKTEIELVNKKEFELDYELKSKFKVGNTFKVVEKKNVLGYVEFNIDKKRMHIENIVATNRGIGYGKKIIEKLFQKYRDVEVMTGYAILEPSTFWVSLGAEFAWEVTEDDYAGVYFELKRERVRWDSENE